MIATWDILQPLCHVVFWLHSFHFTCQQFTFFLLYDYLIISSLKHLHLTGKVTSLVAKKDHNLATRIEEAIMKNESLESLSVEQYRRDTARSKITEQKGKNEKLVKVSNQKSRTRAASGKSSAVHGKAVNTRKISGAKPSKVSTGFKPKKAAIKVSRPLKSSSSSSTKGPVSGGKKHKATIKVSKPTKSISASSPRGPVSGGKKQTGSRKSGAVKSTSKLNVVGFRGRSSSSNKPFRAT